MGLSVRTLPALGKRGWHGESRCQPGAERPTRLMHCRGGTRAAGGGGLRAGYASLPALTDVPRLADGGDLPGSESTFYRVLRARNLQHHRAVPRPHARVCFTSLRHGSPRDLDLGYTWLPDRSPACSTTSTWCWICIRARSWACEVFAEENAEHASQSSARRASRRAERSSQRHCTRTMGAR